MIAQKLPSHHLSAQSDSNGGAAARLFIIIWASIIVNQSLGGDTLMMLLFISSMLCVKYVQAIIKSFAMVFAMNLCLFHICHHQIRSPVDCFRLNDHNIFMSKTKMSKKMRTKYFSICLSKSLRWFIHSVFSFDTETKSNSASVDTILMLIFLFLSFSHSVIQSLIFHVVNFVHVESITIFTIRLQSKSLVLLFSHWFPSTINIIYKFIATGFIYSHRKWKEQTNENAIKIHCHGVYNVLRARWQL